MLWKRPKGTYSPLSNIAQDFSINNDSKASFAHANYDEDEEEQKHEESKEA